MLVRLLLTLGATLLLSITYYLGFYPKSFLIHQILIHGVFFLWVITLFLGNLFTRRLFSLLIVIFVIWHAIVFREWFRYLVLLLPIFLSYSAAFFWSWLSSRAKEDINNQKQSLEKEITKLQKRLENKNLTLNNIEDQANEIIDLFEVAKNFNKCLTIEEIVAILKGEVTPILEAKKSTLILLDDHYPSQISFQAYLLQEKSKEDSVIATDDENFKKEDHQSLYENIKIANEHKEIIRIDYSVQMEDYFHSESEQSIFPLWIFPLVVENKLIAVFVIEGAQINDFAKFAIVASQLALQIKKIKLYLSVRELSITDGLTKVFLRRHFMERFEEELRRSIKYNHSLCVLMIDIDNFKDYNDIYGHLVGDITLKEVAAVIKENVRKVDLIGRYGGEEFILVLPETTKERGVDAAERIRSAVAKKRLAVYDVETRVTLSIGLAAFPDNLHEQVSEFKPDILDRLTNIADELLYQAKDDGRNQVKYR